MIFVLQKTFEFSAETPQCSVFIKLIHTVCGFAIMEDTLTLEKTHCLIMMDTLGIKNLKRNSISAQFCMKFLQLSVE